MNLNHLAIFHATAEEKSVTGAARRLLISQPAVSKQLRQLEKSLDVRLFDRRPRGVQLTEAGVLLASYATRLFSLVEESEQAIGELRGLRRGRLRIGASTTVGVYLLPELLVKFRAKHPGIQLQLEIAASDVLAGRLLDRSVDIVLTEGVIENESLESTSIFEEELVAIAPHGHPRARKKRVNAAMLCREPFVIRETGSGTRSLVERTLGERGLSIKPAMSLGSTEAIKKAVASGIGVAIVSSLSVALEVQTKQLAIICMSDLKISRPIYRLVRRDAYASHALSAFYKMVDEALKIVQKF